MVDKFTGTIFQLPLTENTTCKSKNF